MPPKVLPPIKTGRSPKRLVRASGKARMAKAIKCMNLSVSSGLGGGCLMGQSSAIVSTAVTIKVRVISGYLRIQAY